jgi:cytochrome o ubiquinol oxidase subunit IV
VSAENHAIHAHDAHHSESAPHSTFSGYMIGFVLSVILTAIPFWLVMANVIKDSLVASLVIMGLAVIQIVVHMFYFLHMNTRVEGGWSMLALIFTGVVVIITVSGSVWVMYHMNANMMPMMPANMPMN